MVFRAGIYIGAAVLLNFTIGARLNQAGAASPSASQPADSENQTAASDPSRPLAEGSRAPAVSFTALDGRKFNTKNLSGKYVLLDFWATWCGPCVMEMPALRGVFKKYGKKKDFILLGISLDFEEKTLREFLTKQDISWPQVFGDKSGATDAAKKFQLASIPATFLIGPDGKIIATDFHDQEIAKVVDSALNETKSK